MKVRHFVWLTVALTLVVYLSTGCSSSEVTCPSVTQPEVSQNLEEKVIEPTETNPPTIPDEPDIPNNKIPLVVLFDNARFPPIEAYLTSRFGNFCNIILSTSETISHFAPSPGTYVVSLSLLNFLVSLYIFMWPKQQTN